MTSGVQLDLRKESLSRSLAASSWKTNRRKVVWSYPTEPEDPEDPEDHHFSDGRAEHNTGVKNVTKRFVQQLNDNKKQQS